MCVASLSPPAPASSRVFAHGNTTGQSARSTPAKVGVRFQGVQTLPVAGFGTLLGMMGFIALAGIRRTLGLKPNRR